MTGLKPRMTALAAAAVLLTACSSTSSPAAASSTVAAAANASGPSSAEAPIGSGTSSPAGASIPAAAVPSTPNASDSASAGAGPVGRAVSGPAVSAPAPVAGGVDLTTKGCSAIKIADAQALVKAVVSKIDFTPGDAELDPQHQFRCEFNEQAMLITVHPEDSSKAVYNGDVAEENVPGRPLAGVGDTAVWAGVVLAGLVTSAPDVIAHQGAVTCTVESPGGPRLTIPIDPGPIGGSTVKDAAAYAGKMGALCNDIFGALS